MPGYIYGVVYLIIMNFMAAAATLLDKHRARQHLWRVPERTLLLLAALGGSPAMLLTMLMIRHKTRHAKFMIGLPAILVVQGFAAFAIHRFL